MKDFRRLNVWNKAHGLALAIYKATQGFPVEERYGLTGQLRRAVVSVPTNVAEGCGRNSDGDLARFLERMFQQNPLLCTAIRRNKINGFCVLAAASC